MQQALKPMHSPLNRVLRDSTGATGLLILPAIVAGERDPMQRAPVRNPGCQHPAAAIAKALTGQWPDAQLCILRPSREGCDDSTGKMEACAAEIARP